MTTIVIEYVVMTSCEPPNSDLGYWSRHYTRADAKKTAKQVGGNPEVWKRVDKDGQIVMTKLT